MFRASTDGGKTFVAKINLGNSSNAGSVNASIAAEGDHVYVSWWERNAPSNEPVLRIGPDNGKTFGPIVKLAGNGLFSYIDETPLIGGWIDLETQMQYQDQNITY